MPKYFTDIQTFLHIFLNLTNKNHMRKVCPTVQYLPELFEW